MHSQDDSTSRRNAHRSRNPWCVSYIDSLISLFTIWCETGLKHRQFTDGIGSTSELEFVWLEIGAVRIDKVFQVVCTQVENLVGERNREMLGVAEGEGCYRPEQIITLSIFQGRCTQRMQFDIRHMPAGEFQIEAPELSIGSLRFEAFDELSNSTFKGEIISKERIEPVGKITRLFRRRTNQVVWRHWQGLDER